MNQTWENGKKSNLGPNFDTFGLNLDLKKFFVGFIHLHEMLEIVPSYRCIQFQGKLINQTCENGKKPSFRPHLAQIRTNNFFFFKNLASSVTRYHGQSSSTISEKTNDSILKKFSDGRTDGQVDDSDFIGGCPSFSSPWNLTTKFQTHFEAFLPNKPKKKNFFRMTLPNFQKKLHSKKSEKFHPSICYKT